MIDVKNLKFDANGLIPAVVVDSITKKVLTVAYMNEESLKISMEKGLTCFWSRSRQELWLKGETSGNYQHIVSITADCDGDALTVLVEKEGPACHTGADSCFFNPLWHSDSRHEFSLQGLYELLEGRKAVCFPGFEDELIGAAISDDYVCTCDNIITARGMGSAVNFGVAIVAYFKGQDFAAELKSGLQCS